ncbi:DUF438 domain-containing protein [bacterium]|nr:DUF438 domain-containing protein [bacterium]
MELTPKTRLHVLLREYPFLGPRLVEYNARYASLNNPVLLNTLGRAANLAKVAALGGVPLAELLDRLAGWIAAETGAQVATDLAGLPATRDERRALVKELIKDLHAGAALAEIKRRFGELIEDIGATEIAELEQELIAAGMPQSELTQLCDVHMELFRDSLHDQEPPETPPGHPVNTFIAENRALARVIAELRAELDGVGEAVSVKQQVRLRSLLKRLGEIERHYLRKENQLFPYLEQHGISGPPQVMWSIHDQVRGHLKQAGQAVEIGAAGIIQAELAEGLRKIEDMFTKENLILLPLALDKLSLAEWLELRAGEDHIGYTLIEPGTGWPTPDIIAQARARVPQEEQMSAADTGGFASVMLNLQTGAISPEQVNLLFNHLPVEISFTDEHHIVRFFSEGQERIFPRSPGVIGRHVENCHPPKSVQMVKEILAAFEKGERSVAEFWLELGGRFIHIRYFAVRDSLGRFRGTLEVVQDVTAIRALEGERRLLEWS